VLGELTPKINSLEGTYSLKTQSFFETCFSKNNSADKFASCVYDGTEKIRREQSLFEHKLNYLSLSIDKCLESKDADFCRTDALKTGNEIVNNFGKFLEKL
jgi:hypothetical protein